MSKCENRPEFECQNGISLISYPVWSFRTQFDNFVAIFQVQFLSKIILVISYIFFPKPFRTMSHFIPSLVILYPGYFVPRDMDTN